MSVRKIWVRRPQAVPTQVTACEGDLVDDIKDLVLRRYANSLGCSFDAPDVIVRLPLEPTTSRSGSDRVLGPDENVQHIFDTHFPHGQSMNDALLIDVLSRRTPKLSPRVHGHHHTLTDESRPGEHAADYFPPMPVHGSLTTVSTAPGAFYHRASGHPHSIAVLETGQVPNLPSPGLPRARHSERAARPRYGRQQTASPGMLNTCNTREPHKSNILPALPTPPIDLSHHISTPPATTAAARTASPRPAPKAKRPKKGTVSSNDGGIGRLDGPPPINVLIVEDNIINLKLLEAFLKRLKVRWSTAMNGKIAVDKWRQGGYHLVLMDIQLPVMNGLDATKEIRRLERVNKIGVFGNGAGSIANGFGDEAGEGLCLTDGTSEEEKARIQEQDDLTNTDLFKSPVIIVALTASSLQSDRHEALAAGCNDFLTKPVDFDWLSRKVMEWGCMQALIDFDGWRKWKEGSIAPNQTSTQQKRVSKSSGDSARSVD